MSVISVIIPTYNRAHQISRAVRSVLNQSYGGLEVLVVDDGSVDDTEQILSGMSDDRIRYIKQPHNMGAPAAKNRGVLEARGEYVAFLDSDDEYLPHKLQLQMDVVDSRPEVDVVYAGWEWASESSGVVHKTRIPDEQGRIQGLPRWAFNIGPDLLIRTAIMRETLYDETASSFEHMPVLFRLWQKASTAFVSESVVRCYTHSGERRSDKIAQSVPWLQNLVAEHETFLRTDVAGWGHLQSKMGALLVGPCGDSINARPHLKEAVRAMPMDHRLWFYLVFSYIPVALWPAGVRRRLKR